MALVFDDKKFQYILRILNTNVNGKEKVMYALTKIKGIGRRFANLVCKKAEIDQNKRYVRVASLALLLSLVRSTALARLDDSMHWLFRFKTHSHISSLFLVSRHVPIDAATARLACSQLRTRISLHLAPVRIGSAGELTEEEIETVKEIIAHPRQFSIPDWFLNRQKDVKTGKFMQLTANQVDTKYREDLERMKKIRYVAMIMLVSSTHFPSPSS
jgi:ribosomal protein S13